MLSEAPSGQPVCCARCLLPAVSSCIGRVRSLCSHYALALAGLGAGLTCIARSRWALLFSSMTPHHRHAIEPGIRAHAGHAYRATGPGLSGLAPSSPRCPHGLHHARALDQLVRAYCGPPRRVVQVLPRRSLACDCGGACTSAFPRASIDACQRPETAT